MKNINELEKIEKKFYKIQEMLDYEEYHLNIDFMFNEFEYDYTKWKLFKKYDGWLNDGSEPLMSSDNTSVDELYKFVKKHRKIDPVYSLNKVIVPIVWLILTFMIIRIFFIDNKIIQDIGHDLLMFEFGLVGASIIANIFSCIKDNIKFENLKLDILTRGRTFNAKIEEIRHTAPFVNKEEEEKDETANKKTKRNTRSNKNLHK